jgi:hypothetical protein
MLVTFWQALVLVAEPLLYVGKPCVAVVSASAVTREQIVAVTWKE